MGWFSNNEVKAPKKNVEFIYGKTEYLENEIEARIAEGRIIKDIKFTGDGSYSKILIIYDSWTEKQRAEKEKDGLGR